MIYDYVQQKYPDLCDDAYLCADNCKDGHNRPEWKHRDRAAIWDAKDRSDYVSRDSSRGHWCFGDATKNDNLPQEAASSLFTEEPLKTAFPSRKMTKLYKEEQK